MRDGTWSILAPGAMLILAVCFLLSRAAAQLPNPPAAVKQPDLAPFLDLGKYYVTPVASKKDPKIGFVVGGKNETALIRGLKEINGRAIADLEKDMRPGAKAEVGSDAGFLGPNEKLLDVLVADNRYIVDECGTTHGELAKHLHAIGAIGLWQYHQGKEEAEFVYKDRHFKVKTVRTKGLQPSPFLDGTESGTNVTLDNLDTGKTLKYALLVPYMIERYGFYEGKGTPYRVEPSHVLAVFDFLEWKGKKR